MPDFRKVVPTLSAAVLMALGPAMPALASARHAPAREEAGRAKNVIFMMGDGMGPAERDAIQLATVGAYDRLVMDQLPYTGSMGTNSVDPDTFITDSAAGATAWSIGKKTVNGAVGVDADGQSFETVLEQAKAAGKSAGLVTTSQVTDASPASFASHVEDRGEQSEIARQYIEETGVDVILGGGEDRWYPEGEAGAHPDNPPEDEEEQSSSDKGNLVERARELGYTYVTNASEMQAATGPKLLGLFANEEMFQQKPEPDGIYDPVVSLPEMTQKAIDILSQDPDGFFLFVEEEAIDEMGHENNAELMIKSGQQLDKAVSLARDFAEDSGDTLLIVTADHECCGLVVEGPDDPEYPDENGAELEDNISGEDGPFDVANSDYRFVLDWTTTGHTGVDVPLTAYGPHAEDLVGNYENTHIHEVLVEAMGLGGADMPDAGAGGMAGSLRMPGQMPQTGGGGAASARVTAR
jgi:alkaline phosphatase